MSEYKKIVTKLESSVKPINVDTQNDYKNQGNINIMDHDNERKDVESTKSHNENFEEFHAVNDIIKLSKKKTPIITYIIMILILVILVTIFVIFELPILRGL